MNKKCSNIDELFSVNQGVVDEFCRTQFQTWSELGKLQSDFANLWLECVNAQMQRISSAKNLTDICAVETGLATEYSMKFSDNISKVFDILLNAQKEFMKSVNAPEVLAGQKPLARPEKPGKTTRAMEVDRDTAPG